MDALLRVPHGLIRRHLSAMERIAVAIGLGAVFYLLLTSLPVYPSPWEIVLSGMVALITFWSPPAAYFLAVTAALYPLYSLSLYLAVLFLALALLGQRVFIRNLGATLLVLAAPWLAQYHLEWIAILLGGLWWGKVGGAWIGGLAALWGQVIFGMTGQSASWLDMMGMAPALPGLVAQYQDANSLETLKLLVAPLGPNPTLLLYHLLQIALWALFAAALGGLCETSWVQQKHPWRAISVVIFTAAGLAFSNIGLAYWLQQYPPADFAWIFPGMLESALYSALLALALEGARDFVEHPLALHRRAPVVTTAISRQSAAPAADRKAERISLAQRFAIRLRALKKPVQPAIEPAGPGEIDPQAGAYQPVPVPPNLPHRDKKDQPPDDVIKIELD